MAECLLAELYAFSIIPPGDIGEKGDEVADREEF